MACQPRILDRQCLWSAISWWSSCNLAASRGVDGSIEASGYQTAFELGCLLHCEIFVPLIRICKRYWLFSKKPIKHLIDLESYRGPAFLQTINRLTREDLTRLRNHLPFSLVVQPNGSWSWTFFSKHIFLCPQLIRLYLFI